MSATPILSLILLSLIIYSAYDINKELETVQTLIGSKSSSTAKSPYQEQETSCSDYQVKTRDCLTDAQNCLKVLNSYNNKNKKFEVKVKECQARNAKNSKRNNELKAELERIQKAMKVIEKREL